MSTGKNTAKGSSSAGAAVSSNDGGRGLNATRHPRNPRNSGKEEAYRRVLLLLLSGNFISLEYARNAWCQSLERDINRLEWELLEVEEAIRERKQSKAAEKSPKKPSEEE